MTKAYQNFIPQLWSARLLANLDKNLVFANCVNRDYEGEIKNLGDTVKINQIGDVRIGDYTGDVGAPEELSSTQQVLTIDQAKYFNFKVEDIEAVQANVALMEKAMARASYAIADHIDRYIASFVANAGIVVSSEAVTKENAYDKLVDLKVKFNKANIPQQGRFVVLPPEYIGLLEKDDRFVKDYSRAVLQNGVAPRVAGFDVLESNNVHMSETAFDVMAGTTMAISFAGQIAKVEAYRPEQSFADACKGLYVFGAKVVEPKALAKMTCTF